MSLSRFFGRKEVRSSHRPLPRRRPLVEGLEGRQLLSTVAVTVVDSDDLQRKHVSADVAAIQGNHIGTPAIVGAHIG